MPQLLALALAGAGLVAGYRWLRRLTGEQHESLRQAEATARAGGEPRDLGVLDWDPQANVYRPRQKS